VNFLYNLNKKLVVDPEALYVSFPFELQEGKIYFDVPGGTIEAVKEQIPGSVNDWNVAQNFVSVRNHDEQIILGSKEVALMQLGNINLGRFKKGALPESNHIFSWPMNNYWVTNFDAFQFGEFSWSYYLTSSGDASVEQATKFAWSNRIPLQNRVFSAGVEKPNPAFGGSIISIQPTNILLVNMKPIKEEDALLLQIREISGRETTIELSSAFRRKLKVSESNLSGDVLPTGNKIKLTPWETKFLKVKL
jgi:alpha-mannosidase